MDKKKFLFVILSISLLLSFILHQPLYAKTLQDDNKDKIDYLIEFLGINSKKFKISLNSKQANLFEFFLTKLTNDFTNARTIQEGIKLFNTTLEYLKNNILTENDNIFDVYFHKLKKNILNYQVTANTNIDEIPLDISYENYFCLVLSHYASFVPVIGNFLIAIFILMRSYSNIFGPIDILLYMLLMYSYYKTFHIIPTLMWLYGEKQNTKYWFRSIGLNGSIYISPFDYINLLFFSGITITKILSEEGYCFGVAYKSYIVD